MALEDRIDSLRKKHAHIDQILQEEGVHCSTDQLIIRRLKSLKLGLKDEIERLMRDQESAAA